MSARPSTALHARPQHFAQRCGQAVLRVDNACALALQAGPLRPPVFGVGCRVTVIGDQ